MRRIIGLLILGTVMGLAAFDTSDASGPDTLWTRTYGWARDDLFTAVEIASDGGYILVGRAEELWEYHRDSYVVKTDRWGDVEWQRAFGSRDDDHANAVIGIDNGAYAVTGVIYKLDMLADIFIETIDATGWSQWYRTIGWDDADYAHALCRTEDGGYVIAGYTGSIGAGWDDILLVKLDRDGDTLWTRTYGEVGPEKALSCAATSDGGFILAGAKSIWTGWYYIGGPYLLRVDAEGDTLWTKMYDMPGVGGACSVRQTEDGGYIICAPRDKWPGEFSPDDIDFFIMKTDAWGDSIWTSVCGGDANDWPRDIVQTADGGYAVVGGTRSFGGDEDVYLVKFSECGDTVWTRAYGGAGYDHGQSLEQTTDGCYLIAGYTNSFGAGALDGYVIKTFPDSGMNLRPYFATSLPHPNPLKGSTELAIELSRPEHVTVDVFDALGRSTCRMVDKMVGAGRRNLSVDFTQPYAEGLASGIYFLRIRAGGREATRKIVLLR
jgi:hypothetical protein